MTTWKSRFRINDGPTCSLAFYDENLKKHSLEVRAGCSVDVPTKFDPVIHHILIERSVRRSLDGVPGRLDLKPLKQKGKKTS